MSRSKEEIIRDIIDVCDDPDVSKQETLDILVDIGYECEKAFEAVSMGIE